MLINKNTIFFPFLLVAEIALSFFVFMSFDFLLKFQFFMKKVFCILIINLNGFNEEFMKFFRVIICKSFNNLCGEKNWNYFWVIQISREEKSTDPSLEWLLLIRAILFRFALQRSLLYSRRDQSSTCFKKSRINLTIFRFSYFGVVTKPFFLKNVEQLLFTCRLSEFQWFFTGFWRDFCFV